MNDEYAAVFFWKGGILEEYWYCILNALIKPEDDGKSHIPDLIVDDGGDMTLLTYEGTKAEDLFSMMMLSLNPNPRKLLSSRLSKPSSSTN